MKIKLDWYRPDKVILMTLPEIVDISHMENALRQVGQLTKEARSERVHLLIDATHVQQLPGMIELLSIKADLSSRLYGFTISGLQDGYHRMTVSTSLRMLGHNYMFVADLHDGEKFIETIEQKYKPIPRRRGRKDHLMGASAAG